MVQGDLTAVYGSLEQIPRASNPGQFDERSYYYPRKVKWYLEGMEFQVLRKKENQVLYIQSQIRDSIANHTDKFITFKGLELKHGIQMADALKALEAKGLKRSEQFDYKKRNYHIYSLRGTFYKYRDCNITIYPTKNDKDIFGAISIYLPYRYSFKEMKKDYDYMRHVYGNRYHMVSATAL